MSDAGDATGYGTPPTLSENPTVPVQTQAPAAAPGVTPPGFTPPGFTPPGSTPQEFTPPAAQPASVPVPAPVPISPVAPVAPGAPGNAALPAPGPYDTAPMAAGPGYAQPTQFGAPMVVPQAGAVPARRPSRLLVPVLSVVAVLLLLSTVTFGVLWYVSADHLTQTKAALRTSESTSADRAKKIADDESKIDSLNKDVSSAKDELAATKQQLTGTKNTLATANACLRLLDELGAAVSARSLSRYEATLPKARVACAKVNVGI